MILFMLESRVDSALPNSVSHQPFLVASSAASVTRRSMRSWISFFTFRKGSAATRIARDARTALPSFLLFSTRMLTTLSFCAACWDSEVLTDDACLTREAILWRGLAIWRKEKSTSPTSSSSTALRASSFLSGGKRGQHHQHRHPQQHSVHPTSSSS